MLTTALASLPTTPPDALAAIAHSLAGHSAATTDATHLALLVNPNTPTLDTSDWGTLSASDTTFALEHPDLTASARAAILATGGTLLRVAMANGPVTADELTAEFATREPNLGEALDLLLAPATPHDLAVRAASAFHSDNGALARLASTAIIEAGVARLGLTEGVDRYLHALVDQPHLTWLEHQLAEASHVTVLAEMTRDPDTARAFRSPGNIGLAVNPYIDESICVQALTAHAAFRYAGSSRFRHLSDTGAVTALAPLSLSAQDAIAAAILANPYRSAATLEAIFTHMYGASLDTLYPEPLPQLALHPNCPPDLRAQAAVRADRHMRRPTLALMLDPETILTVPLSDLRSTYVPATFTFLTHHIGAALTAQRHTVTAEQARVVALLEPTFTGTPRELLDTAASVSS